MGEIHAVLDACVLYSFYLREIFMRLDGEEELYRAHWSNEINEEWGRNLLKNKPHMKKKDIDATIAWMNQMISDVLVDPTPFLEIASTANLPDSQDTHVLAAAIASQSQYIVTANLKDFPAIDILPSVNEGDSW